MKRNPPRSIAGRSSTGPGRSKLSPFQVQILTWVRDDVTLRKMRLTLRDEHNISVAVSTLQNFIAARSRGKYMHKSQLTRQAAFQLHSSGVNGVDPFERAKRTIQQRETNHKPKKQINLDEAYE